MHTLAPSSAWLRCPRPRAAWRATGSRPPTESSAAADVDATDDLHLQRRRPLASQRRPAPSCSTNAGRVLCSSSGSSETRSKTRRKPQRKRSETDRHLSRLRKAPLTARRRAVEQLLRIEEQGAFSGLVNGRPAVASDSLDQEADVKDSGHHQQGGATDSELDARDSRLVTDLVNGVTRSRRRLDYILTQFCEVDTVEPPLKQLLRIGVYELMELSMPAHALNNHVELAKKGIHAGAGKFANGVLRNVVRRLAKEGFALLQDESDGSTLTADELAIRGSHPTWMVERWMEQMGYEQTQALMAWNNTRPSHSIRVAGAPVLTSEHALAKLLEAGIEATTSKYLPAEFICITSGLQKLFSEEILPAGSFAVQDESAGLVVQALDPKPGETIIDCCAAPGGKSLFIAERLKGQGKLVSMDINGRRLNALRNSLESRQLENVTAIEADLSDFAADPSKHSQFDRVLLDAPCTGLGVLAKRADMRWRRSEEDLSTSLALTMKLIDAAARLVKPGGVLVYSTCSIDLEENFAPVRWVLEHFPDFALESPVRCGVPPKLCPKDAMQTFPHVHGIDGAFAAKFIRRDSGVEYI